MGENIIIDADATVVKQGLARVGLPAGGLQGIGIEEQPLVIDPSLGETKILAKSETNPAILASGGRIEPHFCPGIGPIFIVADDHLFPFGHGYDRTGIQVLKRQDGQRQNCKKNL
jgi:hypothetical protein